MAWSLLVFLAACVVVVVRAQQDTTDCNNVMLQLNVGLEDCVNGPDACATSASMFTQFVCIDSDLGKSRFDIFASCFSVEFVDQIYATLCTDADTPCFERVSSNNGEAAYSACCNADLTDNCTSECRDELVALVDAQSCCTQTTPYVTFFETCRDSSLDIQGIFDLCGVELPDTCPHIFSDEETPSDAAMSIHALTPTLLAALIAFFGTILL